MKSLIDSVGVGKYFYQDIKAEAGFFYVGPEKVIDNGNLFLLDSAPEKYFFTGLWKYENGEWSIYNQEEYDNCVLGEKTAANNKAKKARSEAYAAETDAMFFKAQRGEATMEEWLAAVQAIKDKYPYI